MSLLLEMKGIYKSFPGVKALSNVQLKLHAGEVHALLGENGAGKSTLIKVLGGIYQADQGELFVNEKKVKIKNVKDAQKYGIRIIHQELMLVSQMTIAENIFLGNEIMGSYSLVNKSKQLKKTRRILKKYGIDINPNEKLGNLTIANRQMIEIVRAISFGAKIIVMDEPTSSLTDNEVDILFNSIKKLKSENVGIIYISHRMSELDRITDRITVMRDGKYIDTVKTNEVNKKKLISMMVGREMTNFYSRDHGNTKEVVLKVEEITDNVNVKNVSFSLKKGEILGFSGLVGSGRSELMKCIFGLSLISKGKIYIEGKEVDIKNTNDAIECGIGLVPENRKEEALYPQCDVQFNMTIEVLSRFIKGIFVKKSIENKITNHYVDQMSIKVASINQLVSNLSGGNQQKVVIGRWLAANPKILILDEPTRGIDIGAKAEIYHIINQLAQNGMAIIMISSELPEIINMSDRVAVMSKGCLVGILDKNELTQKKIMTLATTEPENFYGGNIND